MRYEYLALPAPSQTKSAKGQKTAVDRLAVAMTEMINKMAAEGWEFMRTETLTVEDRPHRFSKTVERIETVVVFRRDLQYIEPAQPNPPSYSRASSAAPADEPLITPPPERPVAPSQHEDAQAPRSGYRDDHDDDHSGPSLGGITRD